MTGIEMATSSKLASIAAFAFLIPALGLQGEGIALPGSGWSVSKGGGSGPGATRFEAAAPGSGSIGGFAFEKAADSWAGLMFTSDRDVRLGPDFRIEVSIDGTVGPGWTILVQKSVPGGEAVPMEAPIPEEGGRLLLSAADFALPERFASLRGGEPAAYEKMDQVMLNAPWGAERGEIRIKNIVLYPSRTSALRVAAGRGFVITGYTASAYDSPSVDDVVRRYSNAAIGILVTFKYGDDGKIIASPDTTPEAESVGRLIDRIFLSGNEASLFMYADPSDGGWRAEKPLDLQSLAEAMKSYIESLGPAMGHIKLVVLGAELSAEETDSRSWNRLIGSMRAALPKKAKLGYAADRSSLILQEDFALPSWVKDLDWFGVTLWAGGSDLDAQRGSYRAILQKLGKMKDKLPMIDKLFIAELGAPAAENALTDPAVPEGREDPAAQERSFGNILGIEELGWYPVFLWRAEPGNLDDPYTWIGRPAEAIVDAWLGGSPRIRPGDRPPVADD